MTGLRHWGQVSISNVARATGKHIWLCQLRSYCVVEIAANSRGICGGKTDVLLRMLLFSYFTFGVGLELRVRIKPRCGHEASVSVKPGCGHEARVRV